MSKQADNPALEATRRAISRIRAYGIDGPRPIEEIEALLEHGDRVATAMTSALRGAAPADLAAAIHLVVLLKRCDVLDTVRAVAFEAPADLDAKREAVAALRACGEQPDDEIAARIGALEAFAEGPPSGALRELSEWPEAWRGPALATWLKSAGPDHVGEVEAALGGDEGLDEALLDWLGDTASPAAADALQRFLAAAPDRRRVKQVKRALHRMRSQGVEVADPSTAVAGGFSMALDSASLDDSRAFVTSVDGRGARLVWVLWRSEGGGSRLLQAVMDDRHGLREVELATVTRTGFREYLERMRANRAVLLEQVEIDTALTVLRAAAQQTEAAGGELPDAYAQWVNVVGAADRPLDAAESAPVYAAVDTGKMGGDEELIDASMTLLREPHFQSWAMEGAPIEAAAEEILQAETSTLMISDEQRRERMEAAIRDAVRASFDAETRRLYRGRLEVMAAMMWDRGEHEEARQALAAAIGLTDIEDLFRGHAFARALAHRGVWLAYQDRQRELNAEQQRSGLIQP